MAYGVSTNEDGITVISLHPGTKVIVETANVGQFISADEHGRHDNISFTVAVKALYLVCHRDDNGIAPGASAHVG